MAFVFTALRALGILAIALAWPGQAALAQTPIPLITLTEAQMPDAKVSIARAITRGPGIRLASPAEVKAASFAMKIAFEPRGGTRIDPASVRLEYLKDPIVDLTARVASGFKGDELELTRLSVPRGTHHLRMSVKDSEGRANAVVFTLTAQ